MMTNFYDKIDFRSFFILIGLFFLLTTSLSAGDPIWNGYGTRNSGGSLPINTEIPMADSSQTRYYLLRTGFLMEGTATNEGKHYVIKTDFGTMHVPTANVEYVGKDKHDIYRYKKSFVDGANCSEQMKFAEWCLSLGLKQEGIAEYELALKTAPNAVLAEVVRERLAAVQRDGETPEENAGATLHGSAAPSKDRDESEVSRWAAGIPRPVVDEYVKKVQPALLAGCAAADCHGSSSENKFKIAKPRQLVGATTHANLRAVLPWISLDYPTESPLLTAMVNYHGNTRAPYTVESRQYNNVLQWIQLTAKELPLDYQQRPNREPIKIDPSEVSEGEPLQVKKETLLPSGFGELPTVAKQPPPKGGKAETDVRTVQYDSNDVDPFDPAVFNARYHGTTLK